jgi:hypothetical protein
MPDVNTQGGFDALLAEQAGDEAKQRLEEREEQPDRDVQGALEMQTESAEGRPRDEHGRFVAAEPESPEEPEEPAAPEEEEPEAEEVPPEPSPLEKQLTDAQQFIGRQSNEVRELREQVAKLEGRFEERSSQPEAPPAPLTGGEYEALEEMVEARGGAATIQHLVQIGRGDLIDDALEAWAEEEPGKAAVFGARYYGALAAQDAEPEEPATPAQPDPALQSMIQERQIADAASIVQGELEEAQEGSWALIKPVLAQTLSEAPEAIQKMVVSEDANTRVEGLRVAAALAKGRVIADATAKAKEDQATQSKAAKQAAQVATGSLRPVEEGKAKPISEMSREEIHETFRKSLLATETTSVADGLTGI